MVVEQPPRGRPVSQERRSSKGLSGLQSLVLLCGGTAGAQSPPASPPPPLAPSQALATPPPARRGSLDKEVIRRTIRGHLGEVKACYERELLEHPELTGRVVVRFVIGGDGRVLTAEVESSTLGSPPAEQCIASQLATWLFPQPRGGGLVQVSYPFVLKSFEAPEPSPSPPASAKAPPTLPAGTNAR